MRRLAEIDVACSPERKQKDQDEAAKKLDEFGIAKKDLADTIREIRHDLDERDQLYGKGDRSGAAKLSSKVRSRIKEVEDSGKKLEKIQKEKHSKLKTKQALPGFKVKEEKVQKDAARKQVVDLTWQHLKELQWRQENPGSKKTDTDRLIESDSSASGERAIIVGGIPDIDDPQFELLRKQDDEIEAELDLVLAGIRRLKQLAMQAGEELGQQEELIEELNVIAEDTNQKLETANRELSKTLKEVRSHKDLCCDLIIFAVILGCAAALYFLLTK